MPESDPPSRASILRVGLVQMRCSDDPVDNLAKAVSGVRDAAERGARLVCLEELFRTTYFCQAEDAARFALAEPIPGPTTEVLGALSRELGVVILGSVFERRAAGVFHNTAVVLDERGELVARYRKMHIPDDPCFLEKFYFTPGDTGFLCVPTSVAKIGPLVCWDQWFPEAARLTALRGAEILTIPTAIGWLAAEKADLGEAQLDAWMTVQRAHAIANGVFVVAINRVGTEGSIEFWGSSFVCDPQGRTLAVASCSDDETLVVDCDLSLVESVRRDWPFLRDRRIDAYGGLDRRLLDENGGEA
jgi:N-carbamoylputrescine amidase